GQDYFLSKYTEIQIDSSQRIEQVICVGEEMLINTGTELYLFESEKLKKLINSGNNIKIFQTKTRTLIRNGTNYTGYSPGSGLGPWFVAKESYELLEDHPQGLIAFSQTDSRFDILSPSFSTINNWYLKFEGTVQDLLYLPNNSFGILTDEQLFLNVNPEGEVLSITELSGINENSGLKISAQDRVWLSNSYGFTILDFNLPFQKINTDLLKSGIVSGCYSNGNLCLSDGYGLYELPSETLLNRGSFYSLTALKNGVLFLENEMLYYYSEGQLRQVWGEKIKLFKVDTQENNILLDLSDRFLIIKPSLAGFFKEYKSFKKDFSQEYSFFNNSLVYFSDSVIYRINIENLQKDSLLFSPRERGQKVFQVLYSNNTFLIGTQEKVYLLKADSAPVVISSIKDSRRDFQRILHTNSPAFMTYWISNSKSPGFISVILPDGKEERIHFLPNEISIFNSLSIIRIGEGEYILINPNTIFHYAEDEHTKQKKFFVIPEKISLNGKEVLKGKLFELRKTQLRESLKNLAYKDNSFEMEFSSSDFLSEDTKFKYILMGRDTEWSDWESGNKIILSKLKPGDYLLKLRLSNENNYISNTFKLNITVLSPFYKNKYAIALYILSFLVLVFVIYRWAVLHYLTKEDKIKVEAFHKSEPEEIVPEEEPLSAKIIENKKSKWDKYSMVTVLFSDIQGFTKIAEMMNPEKLIDELDQFFFHFDSVVDKYNIEKIKTIGDAYMAAGGIPVRNITNPVEVVLAALEMQQYMKQLKKTKVDIWDLRIGIHTGPVIAGEIGHKKRSYDIWGDSVNIASRMESTGEAGKVNVSEVTYNYIKDFFICEYRGKIPVKYKGNLDMYFVTGLRPELSINLVGLPNKMFFLKLQIKRLHDLEEYVFNRMDKELPEAMCFHTSNYAKHVYNHSLLLSKSENLDVEEGLEVRTASLLLHLGYITNYKNPEVESGNIIHDILITYQYSERQINIIRNLILSTKQPYEPQNIMEKIMIDTKMEYLGRVDYIKNCKLLYKEENEMLGKIDWEKWKLRQIDLLTNFEYYTSGARRLREIPFEEQLELLKNNKL
ncbi:MAG: hypothetical protein K9H12_11510, partial [Bacteroidales bacterium]|nr:hypothetical protein [Bacteroidales bacterium]